MRRFCLLTVLFLFFCQDFAFGQGRYDNHKYGFSIAPPSKWSRIPLRPTERWIVARFKSKKEYACEDGWTTHCPVMKVILFAKPKEKKAADPDEPEGLRDLKKLLEAMSNPYKTYKEYLKGNFMQGGYFVSREDSGRVSGMPVTQMEIKVEKLARYGKQRIITWVFTGDIGEFAVETSVLETEYKKLAPVIFQSLKTFRIIPRKAGDADEEESKPEVPRKDLTPEERKQKRIDYAEKICKKAKADLPPGWKTLEKTHFLVIYHTPTSKAIKFGNQADVFRTWLDRNFGRIGTEYCPKCILRICKNRDEENVYRSASGGASSFGNREITTNVDSEDRAFEFEWINKGILHKFFSDKNELLWQGLPFWLEKGLDQYLGTAIASGKRLVFKPDRWEKENLNIGRKKNKHYPLKELMLLTSRDVGNDRENMQVFIAQCGSVVRYLFGPGNRGATRELVFKYLEDLLAVLKEKEKEEEEKWKKMQEKSDEPATEEEEEEEFRRRRAQRSDIEWFAEKKVILEKTFKKTFAKWNDRHWHGFNNNWKSWSK